MGTLTAGLTTMYDDAGADDPETAGAAMAAAVEGADVKESITGSSDSDKITSVIAALVAIGLATDDTT